MKAKKKLVSNYSNAWSTIKPLLAMAPGIFIIIYYILCPAEAHMTSDSTDSLRWAWATFESGKLISDNFAYAAILPFGGNLIFLPFVAIFGYSVTAQLCGLVLFAILFAAALMYMARGMGYSYTVSGGFVSVVMLVLSNSSKLLEIMWEHIFYYNLGLLFFCFGFGLVLRILRKNETAKSPAESQTRSTVRVLVLAVFSFVAATNGLQALVCFTLPLMAGFAAEMFFNGERKLLDRKNYNSWILIGGVFLFSMLGFGMIDKISGGVTAGYADAYSAYSSISTWANNFLNFFNNWFTLIGVSVADGDPLASSESVINILRMVGAIVLLVAPIILACRYNKIKSAALKAVLIGHFAVSAFIIFATVCGKLGGANWRLVPMLGTSVMVTYFAAIELKQQASVVAARFGCLILAVLIGMSAFGGAAVMSCAPDSDRSNSWHTSARVLEEKGLKYGYANFWWAEIITMYSDGEVQVANLYPGMERPTKYNYQQPLDSYEDKDTDRYFLLLTESENTKMRAWLKEQRDSGRIIEEFTIESDPYDLRGYTGEVVYVFVFADNIF